jgi:hypothetical protein
LINVGQGFDQNSFNISTASPVQTISSTQASPSLALNAQNTLNQMNTVSTLSQSPILTTGALSTINTTSTTTTKAARRPLNEIIARLESIKSTTGIIDPKTLVSQISTEDLLALLDYQASGELTDPRIESELYSVLLGINENYIDRNLLDISLKNDQAIKVLYNLRHEQLTYKLNLVKQQLTLKSILEQQLRTQQMTKIRLSDLLKNYEQKLVELVENYRKKLQQLQLVSNQLSPQIVTNQNISLTSLGNIYLNNFFYVNLYRFE